VTDSVQERAALSRFYQTNFSHIIVDQVEIFTRKRLTSNHRANQAIPSIPADGQRIFEQPGILKTTTKAAFTTQITK
jgi:hypothetical protein